MPAPIDIAPIDIFDLFDETRAFFTPIVRKRQKIMLKHVTGDYSFRIPGSKSAALKEMEEQNLESSDSSVDRYVGQYCMVYVYLKGEDQKRIEEINGLLQKGSKRTRPLQILLDCGITTWQQIVDLEEQRKMREETLHAAEMAASIMLVTERRSADEPQHPCETIAVAVQTILDETVRLTNQVTYLEQQNDMLLERGEYYMEELKRLQSKLEAKDFRIHELESTQEDTDAKAIEKIGLAYPTLSTRLFACAEQIRDFGSKRNAIPEELPQKAIWCGNPEEHNEQVAIEVKYEYYYLKFYRNAAPEVQKQMVKQINFLCQYGSRHNSLNTEVMPDPLFNSPADCRWSRISDKGLRFTWRMENQILTLYDAGREENVKRISRTHTKI
ncbi:MAG: hypothetical protein HY617_03945 [Candidatus Sungbacteria bacterium]|nr:hypothetical protein [Candidatus Sungbacteria bacterium]